MINYKKALFLSISIIYFTLPVLAQGGPPATPIDGGLSLLLVAGGAYAIKKMKFNEEN